MSGVGMGSSARTICGSLLATQVVTKLNAGASGLTDTYIGNGKSFPTHAGALDISAHGGGGCAGAMQNGDEGPMLLPLDARLDGEGVLSLSLEALRGTVPGNSAGPRERGAACFGANCGPTVCGVLQLALTWSPMARAGQCCTVSTDAGAAKLPK